MSPHSQEIESRHIKRGEYLFRENDTGECAYLLTEGEVQIVKEAEGKEIILGKVKKGGMFGEMALISNAPRMASARVTKDAKLLVITVDIFQGKVDKLDPFCRAMIEVLSGHITSIANKLGSETSAS